jgi:CubicO group peptidase (beta-lactamase class C family)
LVNQATLVQRNDEHRIDGFHLVSLTSIPDEDTLAPLFTAVWHQYEFVTTIQGEYTDVGASFIPLQKVVLGAMALQNIPAAQLAVAVGDEIVYSRAFTRAPASYAPVTSSTPMNVGSTTKPLTATAALQTVGVAGLGTDIMTLVPAANVGSKPVGLTVRQALQHNTGWLIDGPTVFQTRTMMNTLGPNRVPRGQDYLDFMAQTPGNGLGGVGYNYSNFGFEMLALMVQMQNGLPQLADIEDHDAFMSGATFAPTGMCQTTYKRQGLFDAAPELAYAGCTRGCQPEVYLLESTHPYRQAVPPLAELGSPVRFGLSALDPDVVAPDDLRHGIYGGNTTLTSSVGSGSLVTTAEDLVRFLASFRPFFVDGQATPALSAAEAAQVFPGFGLNVFPAGPGNAGVPLPCPPGAVTTTGATVMSCYGLGWFLGNDVDGVSDTSTDVWHGGNAWGSSSAVLYHPESDVTVAVIFARDYVSGGSIARSVLDQQLDPIGMGLIVEDDDLAASMAHALPGVPDDGAELTFNHP